MCNKKSIYHDTDLKEVKDIIKKYWDFYAIPIDPFKIIMQFTDIKFIADPYLETDKAGIYNYTTNSISLNTKESIIRQRFTLAHMIAHHVYHYPYVSYETKEHFSLSFKNEDEQKANEFAMQLLVPTKSVNFIVSVSEKYGYKTMMDYAKRFLISRKVVEYRLKEIGYLE